MVAAVERVPVVRGRNATVVAHALVDSDDLPLVAGVAWRLHMRGYAYRDCTINGQRVTQLMHRLLLGLEYGNELEADHINRDKLDNRRANLRVVDRRQNSMNHPGFPDRTSRFRGVTWDNRLERWTAQVRIAGTLRHLGSFSKEIGAALAAEAYRARYMPFAEPDPELTIALEVELRPPEDYEPKVAA